jgi:hypothetical protein
MAYLVRLIVQSLIRNVRLQAQSRSAVTKGLLGDEPVSIVPRVANSRVNELRFRWK